MGRPASLIGSVRRGRRRQKGQSQQPTAQRPEGRQLTRQKEMASDGAANSDEDLMPDDDFGEGDEGEEDADLDMDEYEYGRVSSSSRPRGRRSTGSVAASASAESPNGAAIGGLKPVKPGDRIPRKVACVPCSTRKRKWWVTNHAAGPSVFRLRGPARYLFPHLPNISSDGQVPCTRCRIHNPAGCYYPGPKTGEVKERRGEGSSCLQCRSVKRSCDGGRPICARCEKRGITCVYERPGSPGSATTPAPSAAVAVAPAPSASSRKASGSSTPAASAAKSSKKGTAKVAAGAVAETLTPAPNMKLESHSGHSHEHEQQMMQPLPPPPQLHLQQQKMMQQSMLQEQVPLQPQFGGMNGMAGMTGMTGMGMPGMPGMPGGMMMDPSMGGQYPGFMAAPQGMGMFGMPPPQPYGYGVPQQGPSTPQPGVGVGVSPYPFPYNSYQQPQMPPTMPRYPNWASPGAAGAGAAGGSGATPGPNGVAPNGINMASQASGGQGWALDPFGLPYFPGFGYAHVPPPGYPSPAAPPMPGTGATPSSYWEAGHVQGGGGYGTPGGSYYGAGVYGQQQQQQQMYQQQQSPPGAGSFGGSGAQLQPHQHQMPGYNTPPQSLVPVSQLGSKQSVAASDERAPDEYGAAPNGTSTTAPLVRAESAALTLAGFQHSGSGTMAAAAGSYATEPQPSGTMGPPHAVPQQHQQQPQHPPHPQPSTVKPSSVSPILLLSIDYAATLYPGLPAGLLPDPLGLLRALDAYFAYTMHNLIHRPTLEARVCRGEDPARKLYKDRFRQRILELQAATPSPGINTSTPTPNSVGTPMSLEAFDTDRLSPYMDPMLLVAVVWAGARTAANADPRAPGVLDPSQLAAMESWLSKEIDEVAAWFGCIENPAIDALRTEMGITFVGSSPAPAATPTSNLTTASGEGGPTPARNFPFMPTLSATPFTARQLGPSEARMQKLLVTGFPGDTNERLRSFIVFIWTKFLLGDLPTAFKMVPNVSRIFAMCRYGDPPSRPVSDSDPAPVWMRTQERLRLVQGMTSAGVLFAELRNSVNPMPGSPGAVEVAVPPMDETRYKDLELPLNDRDFEALPPAVEAFPMSSTEEDFSYSPLLAGRKTVTFGEAALWSELPRGSAQRETALDRSFGNTLELGPASLLCMISELMRRHARLRYWFAQRNLETYDLETKRQDEVAPEVLAEAKKRRDNFLAALEDARAHLPTELRGAYEEGDSEAMKALGRRYFGEKHWSRLHAFMVWLHVLHILIRSPRDYISALQKPDDPWVRGEGFVECSAHAITVSRLLKSILGDSNVWRIPVFLPVAVLRAGLIHALVLRKMATGMGERIMKPDQEDIIKSLVEDAATCLSTLQLSGGFWTHTRAAHKVLERMVMGGEDPSVEELEGLRGGRPMSR